MKVLTTVFCTFGGLGKGKTASLVERAYDYHVKHKKPVVSNHPLNFPHVPLNSPSLLFDIDYECFLLLDELWHIADSRRSSSVINMVLSMVMLRARKKRWTIGYSQQHPKQTEKRVRYVTELWIEPTVSFPYMVQEFYTKYGEYICKRYLDMRKIIGLYDTEKDVYTLDIKEMRRIYLDRKRRGLLF